eukprot:241975-Chlamydomonas_euryale.AAC.3
MKLVAGRPCTGGAPHAHPQTHTPGLVHNQPRSHLEVLPLAVGGKLAGWQLRTQRQEPLRCQRAGLRKGALLNADAQATMRRNEGQQHRRENADAQATIEAKRGPATTALNADARATMRRSEGQQQQRENARNIG